MKNSCWKHESKWEQNWHALTDFTREEKLHQSRAQTNKTAWATRKSTHREVFLLSLLIRTKFLAFLLILCVSISSITPEDVSNCSPPKRVYPKTAKAHVVAEWTKRMNETWVPADGERAKPFFLIQTFPAVEFNEARNMRRWIKPCWAEFISPPIVWLHKLQPVWLSKHSRRRDAKLIPQASETYNLFRFCAANSLLPHASCTCNEPW